MRTLHITVTNSTCIRVLCVVALLQDGLDFFLIICFNFFFLEMFDEAEVLLPFEFFRLDKSCMLSSELRGCMF